MAHSKRKNTTAEIKRKERGLGRSAPQEKKEGIGEICSPRKKLTN